MLYTVKTVNGKMVKIVKGKNEAIQFINNNCKYYLEGLTVAPLRVKKVNVDRINKDVVVDLVNYIQGFKSELSECLTIARKQSINESDVDYIYKLESFIDDYVNDSYYRYVDRYDNLVNEVINRLEDLQTLDNELMAEASRDRRIMIEQSYRW